MCWPANVEIGWVMAIIATDFPLTLICAKLVARLKANQPSPVLKLWGLAVWASRMMPNPSSNGSKSTMRSCRTPTLLFVPEKVIPNSHGS